MRLRYRLVDVFSDKPLAGNALCVVLDECPDHLMQPIAREANLSETTFPVVLAADRYRSRIFTPVTELPFAGHPTLGTAWALGPKRWTQETAGATVTVDTDESGAVMTQPDPTFEEADVEDAARALGLRPERAAGAWLACAGGLCHLLLMTDEPLDAVVPDMTSMKADRTTAAVARIDDRTLDVRLFAAGVGEDPGTGSAAGPIALLSRRVFGTNPDVTIHQGDRVGRACRIDVHAVEGGITVGGRVAACAEGQFTLG